jgi:hypothetical protein
VAAELDESLCQFRSVDRRCVAEFSAGIFGSTQLNQYQAPFAMHTCGLYRLKKRPERYGSLEAVD